MLPKGRYKKVITDFNQYAVEWFAPTIFKKDMYACGCGRTALATIIGLNPELVPDGVGKHRHFSDKFMVGYLRRAGYKVIPCTQCDMTQRADVIMNEITDDHVVLISQLMVKNEASWSVTYGGLAYHNFYITRLHGLDFLNKPLLSAYVVFHPKWRITDRNLYGRSLTRYLDKKV